MTSCPGAVCLPKIPYPAWSMQMWKTQLRCIQVVTGVCREVTGVHRGLQVCTKWIQVYSGGYRYAQVVTGVFTLLHPHPCRGPWDKLCPKLLFFPLSSTEKAESPVSPVSFPHTCPGLSLFQPKGADRKQKTDREKMEKRTPHEKEKYQPSYETTILTEVSSPASPGCQGAGLCCCQSFARGVHTCQAKLGTEKMLLYLKKGFGDILDLSWAGVCRARCAWFQVCADV